MPFSEQPLTKREMDAVKEDLLEHFGATFLREDEHLFRSGDQLFVTPDSNASLLLPFSDYAIGLPFARERGGIPRLNHELVSLRGGEATKRRVDVPERELNRLFLGQEIPCDKSLQGDVMLFSDGLPLGLGTARGGTVRHRFSKNFV